MWVFNFINDGSGFFFFDIFKVFLRKIIVKSEYGKIKLERNLIEFLLKDRFKICLEYVMCSVRSRR